MDPAPQGAAHRAVPPPAVPDRPGPPARCGSHETRIAEWTCSACGKQWCDSCVQKRKAGPTGPVLAQCPVCRDRCVPSAIRQRREEAQQKQEESKLTVGWAVVDAVTRPLTGWGIFALVFLGLFLKVGRFAAPALTSVIVYPYYLSIVRHAAQGRKGLPGWNDFEDWWDDLILPTIKFFLAGVVALLPAGVYLFLTGFDLSSAIGSATFLVLVAAGLMYIPAVIIFVAMSGELMRALNPVLAVSFLAKLKWDYLILLGGTVGLALAEWVAAGLLPGPFRHANTLLEVYASLATMALYGNVLKRRSRELGL